MLLYKNLILTFIITGLGQWTFADPYTDTFRGKDIPTSEILEYYQKHHIMDKESLVVIGSHYNESELPIAGTGFSASANGKKYIITNSHLIDGEAKFFIHQGSLYPIDHEKTLSCANYDVAIVEIDETIKETFARFNPNTNELYTRGMNNSPRSQLKEEFRFGDNTMPNLNNRPLFENTLTNEMLSYVQIGNMYDLSCNFYPSSPERYEGNALFVPVSQAIKSITNEPIPYKQNHFNKIGTLHSMIALTRDNECIQDLDSKEKTSERSKQSILSKTIITPSSIVPGMSGSPLLQNNDLRQTKYNIVGIATSYDRIMQKSLFASHTHIKNCLKEYIKGSRGHLAEVKFKYSKKYNSTYRVREGKERIEELPITHAKASGDLSNTKIKELYDLFVAKKKEENKQDLNKEDFRSNSQTIEILRNFKDSFKNEFKDNDTIIRGGNDYGNGGGPIASNDIDFKEKVTIPTGLAIDDKLIIGFECQADSKEDFKKHYIFANWEGLQYRSANKCHDINSNDNINLSKILKNRIKWSSSNTDKNNKGDFKVKTKVSIKKDHIQLRVSGKYNNKNFKKNIKIDNDLKEFSPRIKVELDKDYALVADIKELFFTDMLNVEIKKRNQSVESALKDSDKVRVLYSLIKNDEKKGSIPLVNTWKK